MGQVDDLKPVKNVEMLFWMFLMLNASRLAIAGLLYPWTINAKMARSCSVGSGISDLWAGSGGVRQRYSRAGS